MLVHNVRGVSGAKNVVFHNRSIVDLISGNMNDAEGADKASGNDFNILFLDPEWGGVDYKQSNKLRLTIAEIPVEEFVLNTLGNCPACGYVVLKLPVNYDNNYLEKCVTTHENAYKYQLYQNLAKMTLTIIHR